IHCIAQQGITLAPVVQGIEYFVLGIAACKKWCSIVFNIDKLKLFVPLPLIKFFVGRKVKSLNAITTLSVMCNKSKIIDLVIHTSVFAGFKIPKIQLNFVGSFRNCT